MGSCLSTDDSGDEVGCGRVARAKRKQRKRRVMEVLAAEAKTNELLCRMPGRMSTNGSSSCACIFTQQGRKGTNQDAMVVWENFASRTDTTFCGVFDGHGPFGHLVARKVRDSLPSKLSGYWKAQLRGEKSISSRTPPKEGTEPGSADTSEAELDADQHRTFATWKESFLKAFHAMDKELRTHPTIDCFCSGTTAVTMLLQGQDLVIGNVGDSRAVLGTLKDDDTLEAVQLTIDLKPNLPLEAERIKKCRGRVFALEDEPEVARVWLPHDDSPGLAMARAFGDFCLKDFGLIAVPEVTYRRLKERDQFVVLASDGVWDVLSNKEVVEVISTAPTRTTAARALVETAVRAWRLKYPTSKIDDCAVVCLYLNDFRRPKSTEILETPPEIQKTPIKIDNLHRSDTVRSTTIVHVSDDPPPSSPSSSSSSAVSPPLTPSIAETADQNNPEITIVPEDDPQQNVARSASRRSLAECLSAADDDEWSALEGVARVNSLLNLPRFLVGDKRAAAASRGSAGGAVKRRH